MSTQLGRRGNKYYVMQYTSYEGLEVMHVTDVEDMYKRWVERHKLDSNFKFFELDRFFDNRNRLHR